MRFFTTTFTQHLRTTLIGAVFLSSCSRPVAYFQRGTMESLPAAASQSEAAAFLPLSVPASPEPAMQPGKTKMYHDVYARRDNQVVAGSHIEERMNRMKDMGVSTRMPQRLEKSSTNHRMNRVERLVLKVMNRKISRQLAPRHPEKAMINKPIQVIVSSVLLVGGLLLLILGSGTVAFIGLILSLVGGVGVIVGLFGI